MSLHYRCKWCRARRSLNRPPAHFVRVPKCGKCDTRKTRGALGVQEWTLDKYRVRVERGLASRKNGRVCFGPPHGCYSYHFPHRRGSGVCIHNPKLTEEMLREHQENAACRRHR